MVFERERLRAIIRILSVIVLFFVMFPYLTPLRTKWDTQPWALLFAVFYLAASTLLHKRLFLHRMLYIIAICTLYGVFVTVVFFVLGETDVLLMLRRMVAYMTFVFVSLVSFREHGSYKYTWLVVSVFLWFFGLIIQKFVDMQILSPLLPRLSVRPNQGVTSLSPEPSYYAIQMGFFLLLNDLYWREKRYDWRVYVLLVLAIAVQLVASLSGTSLIVLLALFVGLLEFMVKLDKRITGGVVVLLLLLSAVLFPLYWPKIENSRPVVLATRLEKVVVEGAPVSTIVRDRSVVYRSITPIVGIYGGLVVSRGIGFGWGRVTDRPFPPWLVSILGPYRYSGGQRVGEWRWGGTIMGGMSSAVYELGIIGLVYIAAVYYIVLRAFRSGYVSVAALFLFAVVTIGGFVSLAHPMFGYLIGAYASKLEYDRSYATRFSS